MKALETNDLTCLIPVNLFSKCLIDGLSREDIIALFPGRRNGAYYLDKFIKHLHVNYKFDIRNYCYEFLNIQWPMCPVKNRSVGFKVTGKGLVLSQYNRGGINKKNCPAFAQACSDMSIKRRGAKNPMFGKQAWNSGLDKSDQRIKKISEKLTGIKRSDATKQKLRIVRENHPLKARHTTPHSSQTKNLLREKTAQNWASGKFSRISSIHIRVRQFLDSIKLKESLEEEFQVKYFSMDFAFPSRKIAIECQGTYFHIDPRIYPLGPKDAIQRRNFGRDKAKKKFCCDQLGWKIIELWETEINDGSFKEILLCELRKSDLLEV